MSSTGILSLPTEVLDEVYGYLDWDSTISLSPQRVDIYNISLVCKRLRETSLPALFRTVTLHLKFADGTLVEPGLYRLRQQRPDLAKHVRCVRIQTDYEMIETPLTHQIFHGSQSEIEQQWECVQQRYEHTGSNWPFVLAGDALDPTSFVSLHFGQDDHRKSLADRAVQVLHDTNFALEFWGKHENIRWSREMQALHLARLFKRQRFAKDLALELARQRREDQIHGKLSKRTPATLSVDTSHVREYSTNASEVQNVVVDRDNRKDIERLQSRQDALVLAIACIPTSVDHLFFLDTQPINSEYRHEQDLTLSLFAETIRVFGPQLRTITKPTYHEKVTHDRYGYDEDSCESLYLNKSVIAHLSAPQTLRLGGHWTQSLGDETFREWDNWVPTSSSITRLELWGQRCRINNLVDALRKFSSIGSVLLSDLTVILSSPNPVGVLVNPPVQGRPSLIHVAFELRSLLPTAQLRLRNLKTCIHDRARDAEQISTASEERFVESEVLNVYESIDESRKQNLLRDYESFLSLWAAIEADCKDQRAQAKRFAQLADEAMASRFQSHRPSSL